MSCANYGVGTIKNEVEKNSLVSSIIIMLHIYTNLIESTFKCSDKT